MRVTVLQPRVAPARPRRLVVRPRADLQTASEVVGKGLGLFVLFTSTMNWWYYRRVREEAEKNKDKK